MKIGILKMGALPPAMAAEHGEYDEIFERRLRAADPNIETLRVDIVGGEPLPGPDVADGWLVTGSRHGVYEDHPWIEPAKAFLRAAIARKVPVVGVCFGHQLLAEALGGHAEKSDRGWMLGVKRYESLRVPGWMKELSGSWSSIAVHQDQVVTLPEGATVLARSDTAPYAALAYGDPETPYAISVQPHPEYDDRMLRDLIELRMKKTVPADICETALDSLGQPLASDAWFRAMLTYLRAAQARRTEREAAQT